MDQVRVWIVSEFVRANEVVQRRIDLLELPGNAEFDLSRNDFRVGRYGRDVCHDLFEQCGVRPLIQQIESGDLQVGLLAQTYGRPPLLPATLSHPGIERRAKQSDHIESRSIHIPEYNQRYI